MATSWHKLQIGLYFWFVGVSLEHQRNYAWALALLSSHRPVGRGKTVPERVWSLGVDNATSLSAGVPPLHLGWRLEREKSQFSKQFSSIEANVYSCTITS